MRSIKILVFVLILLIPVLVFCADETVKIRIVGINFTNYDPSSNKPTDSIGSIFLTYDLGSITTVKIDAGQNAGSPNNFRRRKLSSGKDTLEYNIYTDAACTKIWGDGTNNSYTLQGQNKLVVYARILPHQYVAAGVYTDRVTITVEW